MRRTHPSSSLNPSPGSDTVLYLAIGYLRRPHGLRGEMVMEIHTDFPERLQRGRKVYLGEDHRPTTIASIRPHKDGVLIAFQGIQSPEEAAAWRNQWVYVRSDELPPLPAGEYYAHQLIGLQVFDESERLLGELIEVLDTPANKVYLVRKPDGKELLLPAIPQVILSVHIEEKRMRVHLLPGLE